MKVFLFSTDDYFIRVVGDFLAKKSRRLSCFAIPRKKLRRIGSKPIRPLCCCARRDIWRSISAYFPILCWG